MPPSKIVNSVGNAELEFAAGTPPTVVIYTHSLLEGSMTFIKSQAETLQTYMPIYVGAHRIHGIPLPDDRTFVANTGGPIGKFREAMFRNLGIAPSLVSHLQPFMPRVVHTHFGTCGPTGLLLANRLSAPHVVTFHGQDATMTDAEARRSYRGRQFLRSQAKLINGTRIFIAVSEFIRQRLLEKGYPPEKVIVHRNGIDLDTFRNSRERPRDRIIVFVGRFVEKKGCQYLIDAASHLRRDGIDFRLVMIGDGPMKAQLEEHCAQSRVDAEFTGFLTADSVREWIARASVVAVPSVTAANGDSEGLPTILLEAQAMETPVVATRHSGIPEGTIEGVTAELVEERDYRALARELAGFLESPDKVSTFGKAGRQFVASNFCSVKQASGLESIYAKVSRQH